MKKYLVFAAAASLFAACSSDDLATSSPTVAQQTADDGAVMFDAYVNRGTTRAGWAGTLSLADLKDDATAHGFGVFGYYTNGENYSETARPDFMYNQNVRHDGSVWYYSPIKYWPNEFGQNAVSEEIDRLTFFAYAPYVEVTPSTGIPKKVDDKAYQNGDINSGIVGMSRNTATGNPLIKYYASLTPAECVDLCWGVAPDAFSSTVDGSANNSVTADGPWLNVAKPQIQDKIKFQFHHALAQLNVQIDTDVDVTSHQTSALDGATKIWVRSITFEGFTTKGALDLNSEYEASGNPNWFDLAGTGKLSTDVVTIYDGRRDGKEGLSSAEAKNETPKDLNAVIVQSAPYEDANLKAGVTNTAVNLFNSDVATEPVLVIPNGEPMKVTIVYDVETIDDNLPGYLSDGVKRGSTIENAITQDIVLSSSEAMILNAGKKFTVKLHLGLTSVKFEADVAAWVDGTEADTDLPINSGESVVPTSGANGGTTTMNISNATTGSKTFTITGLTSGDDISVEADPSAAFDGTPLGGTADAEGKVDITYNVKANETINNRVLKLTAKKDATTVHTITINQAAAALGFTGAVYDNTSTPKVTCTITNADVTDLSASGITVTITKGTETIPSTSYSISGKEITFGNAPENGEYSITIKAGDAEPVTRGFTVS